MTRSLLGLYIARGLQGVATAIVYTVGPAYVAEISHPDKRGQLIGHMQTAWFIGVIYTFSIGPYLSYQNFIYASSIPAFLFMGTFVFMPESPYFLLLKGRKNQARESLQWLRGTKHVSKEMESIEESISLETNEKSSGWNDLLFSSQCRKPLLFMSFMIISKNFAGISVISNYVTATLAKGGLNDSADLASIVVGIILLIASATSAFIVDCCGRKPLIIASTLGIGIASIIIAVYFYIEETWMSQMSVMETESDTMMTPVSPTNGYDWVLMLGFAIFCIAGNIGLGPVQVTIQAECFPSHVRAAAGAFFTILANIIVFIATKQYQLMGDYIGLYSNYSQYAVVALLSVFIYWPFMDETAKKSLSEIQQRTFSSKTLP